MSDNGWIKIHRQILDDPSLMRGDYLAVWVYILLSVNHTETKELLAGKTITVKPGQGIFSTLKASDVLEISVSKIRRILQSFENEHQIEQQKTTKGTVITVVNWGRYQQREQQNEQQVNINCTSSEHQVNNLLIIKECKNDKNERNNNNNTNVLFVNPSDDEHQKDYQSIMDEWNSLPVKNIIAIKGKRLDMLRARIKDYGYDDVISAIKMIRHSKFLLGQNKQGWQICFDWFIKPNNFLKVLEGNYDDRQRTAPTGKNDMQAGFNEAMSILGLGDNDG